MSTKFFGRPTSIGKLELDADAVSSDSDKIQSRLDRIANNYERLDEILTTLEAKIAVRSPALAGDLGTANVESTRRKPR